MEQAGMHEGRNILLIPYTQAELEELAAKVRLDGPAAPVMLRAIRIRLGWLCLDEDDIAEVTTQVFRKQRLSDLNVAESISLERALASACRRRSLG